MPRRIYTRRPLAERFWEKVDIRSDGECWPWLAGISNTEYGQVWSEGCTCGAHRIAWELTYGPIPEGMCVCHHCDNKTCCNPKHLFLGTSADNTADRVKKDRSYHPDFHGEKHTRNVLTAKQVYNIRRRYAKGNISQRKLAAEYGVSRGAITGIVYRHNWQHLPEEEGT